MKQTIFLIVTHVGVDRMVKNLPRLNKGEYPVKVNVQIDDQAFRTPMVEKEIHVTDWLEGLSIGDVELSQPYITEKEAEQIRAQRRAEQIDQLKSLGYKIEPPEAQ